MSKTPPEASPDPRPDPLLDASAPPPMPVHRFAHEAMATTFGLTIAGQTAAYAGEVAAAAFEELDRLDRELSRFVSGSDVACINRLRTGEHLRVGMAVYECLKTALWVGETTGGAFDVTVGPLVGFWHGREALSSDDEIELERLRGRVGMDRLAVHPNEPRVGAFGDEPGVDLGGIGKGYALDVLAGLLAEWGVTSALLHGGQSTVLALGGMPDGRDWPLALRHPHDPERIFARLSLNAGSLSGSGIQIHGCHIIDPRTGRPAVAKMGTWSLAPTGAISDALSTAFIVMTPAEIERYCGDHPQFAAMLMLDDDKVLRFGDWRDIN